MFFDKLGEGKITDHKKVAANIYRDFYEISLRNHKKESVLGKVREHQYGDWIILLPSPKYTKKNANTLEFAVLVEADEQATITYTSEYKF